MHKPIVFKDLSLSFSHKICFDGFSPQIPYGSRIAIMGRNGCGKTRLLNMVCSVATETDDTTIGYVPQVLEDFDSLSGGQRFNAVLTKALSSNPNVLLLDEPTNHLDRYNRKSLLRMLQAFQGTLILVTHDTELLRCCADIIWHMENNQIHIFSGKYEDYKHELKLQRTSLEEEIAFLKKDKKDIHKALMKEQVRASKSKTRGAKSIEQRKWPTIVNKAKAGRSQQTSGRKKKALDHKKQALSENLSSLHLPETILPKFFLSSAETGDRVILSIQDGSIGYQANGSVLRNIHLTLHSKGRLAIIGDNGSGKTTLVRAILKNPSITRTGSWYLPKTQEIGYLDQHYKTLVPTKTVLETIGEIVPSMTFQEIRQYLNHFLFRKNEEVNMKVSHLSGGEKARLSLAQIAVKPPKLLILDEMTNNLDLETREHIVQVLAVYPGAMILISHDMDFLVDSGITEFYEIEKGKKNES